MPDISSIAAGLEALRNASEIVKYLRSVDRGVEQAEFKLKLADLTETLAEIKLKLVEAQEDNLNLRREIVECKKKHESRGALRVENNVYVPAGGMIEGYGVGPWCTQCFDTSGMLITLHKKVSMAIGDYISYMYECPSCKSSVACP